VCVFYIREEHHFFKFFSQLRYFITRTAHINSANLDRTVLGAKLHDDE
jgi:hypothetical protein